MKCFWIFGFLYYWSPYREESQGRDQSQNDEKSGYSESIVESQY